MPFHDLCAEGLPDHDGGELPKDSVLPPHRAPCQDPRGRRIIIVPTGGAPPAILRGWCDRVPARATTVPGGQAARSRCLPGAGGLVFTTANTPTTRKCSCSAIRSTPSQGRLGCGVARPRNGISRRSHQHRRPAAGGLREVALAVAALRDWPATRSNQAMDAKTVRSLTRCRSARHQPDHARGAGFEVDRREATTRCARRRRACGRRVLDVMMTHDGGLPPRARDASGRPHEHIPLLMLTSVKATGAGPRSGGPRRDAVAPVDRW
jgi:hypothetical protein